MEFLARLGRGSNLLEPAVVSGGWVMCAESAHGVSTWTDLLEEEIDPCLGTLVWPRWWPRSLTPWRRLAQSAIGLWHSTISAWHHVLSVAR